MSRRRVAPTMSLQAGLLVLSGVVIAGVAVVGIVLLSIFSAQRVALRQQQDLVRASASQGALLARYVDEETALRGYLLGGKEVFLNPLDSARTAIPALARDLTDAVSHDPDLAPKAATLLQTHRVWEDDVLQPELTTARAGDVAAARAQENSGTGKERFDAVRATAAVLGDELRSRSVAAGRRVATLSGREGSLLVGALLGLVALVAIQLLGTLRLVVAPLVRLGRDVRMVAGGEHDHPVSERGPRELAALGRDTEAMRVRLRAELEEVTRSREALAQSGPAVLALQAALSPTHTPAPGLALAYRLEAAEGVLAGDWLDTLALPGRRLGIVLGDVSGHGPGPAVFALRLKHMLAAALTGGRSPGESLQWAARHLGDTDELFATVFVALVDPGAQLLTYANAGHPEAMLLRSPHDGATDRPEYLPATGPLLSGLVAGWGWGDSDLAYCPGDLLLAYTDGLLEARDSTGRQFGAERLLAAVGSRFDDLDSILDRAVRGARHWGGQRFVDDCTLVACRHVEPAYRR